MNPRSWRLLLVVLSLPPLLGACSERMGEGFDWKRMRVQHRDDPYGSNPAFADGSAMRVVPPGTISRESMPAGSPPPATDLARGQSRFHIFCAVCHGERGDGVSIVASDMDDPKPPSLIAAPVSQLQPSQIYDVITNGFGRMPAFSSQLLPADRWQVIAYLAELQRRAGKSAADGVANGVAPMRRVNRLAAGAAALGAVLVVIGLIIEPRQALTSYLFAYAVLFTIVLGALFHLMIGQLTGAQWFDAFRGLALDVTGAMPAVVVLALPMLVGVRVLYPWAMPSLLSVDVQQQLARKHIWLNVPFFVVRAIVYLAIWTIFAELVRRLSLARDRSDGPGQIERAHRLRKASAAGLVFVGVAMTFASFDWLMSLEPTWYSTIYGIYLFAGGILAALAVVAVLASRALAGSSAPLDTATEKQRAALGTLLFTYTIFWAYIGFSQYLIIWIGDVPADASWYVTRTRTSWGAIAAAVAIGQFALPFLLLLPFGLKRSPRLLAGVGAWLVAMHVVDLYWVVLPALHPEGIRPSWLDAAAVLLVGGVATGTMRWREGRLELRGTAGQGRELPETAERGRGSA